MDTHAHTHTRRYVLASGLLGFLLFNPLMNEDYWWLWLVELIPAFSLYRFVVCCGTDC